MSSHTWHDFKVLNGGVEGARAAFEGVCESLYRKMYSSSNVRKVEVNRGDGGIDIFIGEIGVSPITVVQCKFFLDEFGDSQKSQVRQSFATAINSTAYEVARWILCIPISLTLEQNQWWSNWKDKVTKEFKREPRFIQLKTGNELLDLLKTYGLYEDVFNVENSLRVMDIHKAICSNAVVELSNSDNYTYEESLLKVAYLMTKENALLVSSQKRTFDTIVCALIYDLASIHNREVNSQVLLDEFKKSIRLNVDRPKIEAALSRLKKQQRVIERQNCLQVSKDFTNDISASNSRFSDDLNTITTWILQDLEKSIGFRLNEVQRSHVKSNSIEAIVLFHKLYVYYILVESGEVSNDQLTTSLVKIAQRNLLDNVADQLILIIGRMLSSPSSDQSVVLDRLRKTYLGLQLLGLDPKVHSIRGVSFSGKTYILDTDFVLNLIAPHAVKSPAYRRIVNILISNKAMVKIPTEVLDEVCYHARSAPPNYRYFADAYDRIDRDLLLHKVNNVFVESYFNRPKSDIGLSLDMYIRNFYEERDPVEFLRDYIRDEVSPEIEIFSLEVEAGSNSDGISFLSKFEEGILRLTLQTEKSEYRAEDENKRIAHTDALMYALHYRNERYSVITTSTRALRVARELSIYRPLFINPLVLLSYMELEVTNSINYADISSVLFNPFIQFAINDGWSDIKKIVDLGGDLRGAKITRLKRDLRSISEKLLYESDVGEVTQSDLVVISELEKRDYRFSGEINDLIANMRSTKIENDQLRSKLMEYEEKERKRGKYIERYKRNKKK